MLPESYGSEARQALDRLPALPAGFVRTHLTCSACGGTTLDLSVVAEKRTPTMWGTNVTKDWNRRDAAIVAWVEKHHACSPPEVRGR